MTPKGGLSCKTRSIYQLAHVGALVGPYLKIQWVVHTLEWELETLTCILWAGQNVNERKTRWGKS